MKHAKRGFPPHESSQDRAMIQINEGEGLSAKSTNGVTSKDGCHGDRDEEASGSGCSSGFNEQVVDTAQVTITKRDRHQGAMPSTHSLRVEHSQYMQPR